SRDRIRNFLTGEVKKYLELEDVDLTKSSFLSYIIDVLSVLTSNLLFYQISTYREFFLTKAQLPESVYNLAAYLGYTPHNATAASVSVLFSVPFGFQDSVAQFQIPSGFKVYSSDDIVFTTDYTTKITVTNNSQVSIVVEEENTSYNLPVIIDEDKFMFLLTFKQVESTEQEFQVSDDLKQYQFVSFDVEFEDQLSEISVTVQPPDSPSTYTYTQVSSLFLMDQDTKGFVCRRTDGGLELQFGNGLIGYQPEAGATVRVTLDLTKGSSGNVIAGSITNSDSIYITTDEGTNQVVEFSITNPSPAYGGEDEESIEDIRKNAISNLTALNRLVTEDDFKNVDVITENTSILGQNSLPILKRSDLKANEVTLFSTINFASELVPTRNMFANFTETQIPRGTVLTHDTEEYCTIFDMEIEPENTVAYYTYVVTELEQVPSLVSTTNKDYYIYASNLNVTRTGNQATFELEYQSSESDSSSVICVMQISESGDTYNMTNDGTSFTTVILDYTDIPTGEITCFFTLSHPSLGEIRQYSTKFIFRMSLDDFTMSNVVTSGSTYTVYDIPCIKKSYYDEINKRDFESQVIQVLLNSLVFKDYKMITTFINYKFANTTGALENMQLNKVNLLDVLAIKEDPPANPTLSDRYIVAPGATGVWENHENYIATAVSDGTSIVWSYQQPKTNDIVKNLEDSKRYIYTDSGWINATYSIPLQISLDIFMSSSYSGTLTGLMSTIRETLVEAFSDRFGLNVNIYRSEIIDIVQEIDGVDHCRLLKPESDVFFNYNLDLLSQEELLRFTPEYVYFTEDDITIRIL
ncbi:MAG: hypothetical protein DRH37_11160, partial [Deltaproteobacteria bacterium]